MKKILLTMIIFCSSSLHNILLADEKLIVYLKSSNIAPYEDALEGFKEALEKTNIKFRMVEYVIKSDIEKIMKEPQKPDLFLTIGSQVTEIVANKIKNIPIIFSMVMNPNFNGGNITGVSLNIPPLLGFKTLKKILPKAKKIGLIYNPKKTKDIAEKGISQAKEIGLEIVTAEINSVEDVYGAIRSIGKRIDALWMIPDTTVYTANSTEDILIYTLRERIPVIGLSPTYVKAGALFSLSCNYKDIGRKSGEIAVKILNGEKPSNIKVLSPETIEISVNLITAERIGIEIPEELIKEANNVYK